MNNIGRYCDYRGCYKEYKAYYMKQFGEFFVSIYSCEEHRKELENTFKELTEE